MSTGQQSGWRGPQDRVSRRAFVRLGAGGILSGAAIPLLNACLPVASTTETRPTSTSGSVSSAATRPNTGLPSFISLQSAAKPDYASAGPQYEDGWDAYPWPPVKAWSRAAPGLGSTIHALSNAYNPPSTPLDQNPAWQAVNNQLNATILFNVLAPADYPAKVATTMAGDDLPDIIHFPGGLNVTLGTAGTANLPQFLKTRAADLTPYLAGDAVRDYPFLAAVPTYAWANSGSAFEGGLYMLPIQRYQAGTALFKNVSVYDHEIGADYVPRNAEDLKKVYLQLNRPADGRYATASYQGQAFFMDRFYSALFGAPNNWKLEAGKLTKNYETPEYREAIAYVRDLYVSGVFHPKTLNYADINAARLDYVGGQFVVYPEGFGQNWQDFWRRGLRNSPPYTFAPLPPFPAHDGGTAQHFMGPGFIATNALKRAPETRIKEILGILDFLAAPFGSQEDLLLQYGVQGVDWSGETSGKIVLNERSNVDANYVNWKYLMQHPQVMYAPDLPGYARAAYDAEHMLLPAGVTDPTWGLYSPTLGSKGPIINRAAVDGVTDIVAGRRPLSDFGGIVQDWLSNGGEQIRKELTDAMAARG
jgi:putative aldouronate transport system substrate-binding protein